MLAEDEIRFLCQYCGYENSVWVDLTVGSKQDFVEDCAICCRPNRIIITVDDQENITIEARPVNW